MRIRRAVTLRGVVQGVGLRPWAARTARALGLAGRVCNAPDGARAELEGEAGAVLAWLRALRQAPPPGARVESVDVCELPVRGDAGFRIDASVRRGDRGRARVPPDVPVCDDCLAELFDPGDRRHRHPFTHCAACGPRASVLADLPWDRARTALARFALCARCRREYADEGDRRFHAESVACPDCGPRLAAREPDGTPVAGDPVERAATRLRAGGIVALQGYGGFHLACDATRPEAVARLRKRKRRPAKPFAVLVPDLATARRLARLDAEAERWLAGSARAVVLAPRREEGCAASGLAEEVAPGCGDLGLVLPYAPLHWLLLYAPGDRPGRDAPRLPPLVFTSANRSEEPTVWDAEAAPRELAGIADLVVSHDRAVLRPNDDAVVRAASGGPVPVRLSRGTAPLVLPLPAELRAAPPVVAVGGDLKCAPALAFEGELWVGEHVGDLGTAKAVDALERRVLALCRLRGARPAAVACDLHPDYAGTAVARGLGPPVVSVQHHRAHALAALAEHGHTGPALAWVLDGAGFGPDGTVWGGELLRLDLFEWERLAWLERVPLPGGDAAVREPWRMAAAWLDRAFPEGAPPLPWHGRRDPRALAAVRRIAERGLASPLTSSCGRLFDAVASLVAGCDAASYEGEAAARLEALAAEVEPEPVCGTPVAAPGGGEVPAADLVRAAVRARARGEPPARIARRFHAELAARLAAAAGAAAREHGLRTLVLGGGCLQNRILAEELRARLREAGLDPLCPRRLPPNDGGLAAGQALAVCASLVCAPAPVSTP